MSNPLLLSHHRRWKTHLAVAIVQLLLAIPFVAGLWYLLPPNPIVSVLAVSLLLFNLVMSAWQIWFTVSDRSDFFCSMDSERIRCECPVTAMGSTFDLELMDIQRIIHSDGRISLRNGTGDEVWLTSNYGNPAARFAQLIVDANPAVTVERC
ncbi:MAG: hypothetical protein NXI04_24160 [Planctomycetaceae bacterium]|nr:hypothetical protein [Planctomycetaceae bacterium]